MKWNRILALGMGTALCLSLMAGCGSGGDISSSDTQEDGFPELNISLAHSAATSHAHKPLLRRSPILFRNRPAGRSQSPSIPPANWGTSPLSS